MYQGWTFSSHLPDRVPIPILPIKPQDRAIYRPLFPGSPCSMHTSPGEIYAWIFGTLTVHLDERFQIHQCLRRLIPPVTHVPLHAELRTPIPKAPSPILLVLEYLQGRFPVKFHSTPPLPNGMEMTHGIERTKPYGMHVESSRYVLRSKGFYPCRLQLYLPQMFHYTGLHPFQHFTKAWFSDHLYHNRYLGPKFSSRGWPKSAESLTVSWFDEHQ
jgi:hypothetical protein